jgi:hypothetical protein
VDFILEGEEFSSFNVLQGNLILHFGRILNLAVTTLKAANTNQSTRPEEDAIENYMQQQNGRAFTKLLRTQYMRQ